MTPAWLVEILKAAAATGDLIDAMKDNLGSCPHRSYADAFICVIQDATEGLRRGSDTKQPQHRKSCRQLRRRPCAPSMPR